MRDGVWNNVAISKSYENMDALLEDVYIKQGKSMIFVANFIGCTIATVRNLLDWHDIERRGRPKLEVTIPKKELKECSLGELEARYKLSRSKIFRMRKKAGLVSPVRS